jgi:protein TonB
VSPLGHEIGCDVSRARGPQWMAGFAQPFMPKGAALPLVFSLLAHAGLAAVAVHRGQSAMSMGPAATAAAELSAPDLVQNESAAPDQPASVAPVAHVPNVTQRAEARAVAPAAAKSPRESTAALAAASVVSASPESEGPRFVMTVLPTAAPTSAATSATGAGGARGAAPAPISESAVETPARLEAGSAPAYTFAALSAGIEADVPLEIVVSESGGVVSARSLAHVGYGLDEAALESVRAYRFTPALRDRRAVAVRMHWLMRFQLH